MKFKYKRLEKYLKRHGYIKDDKSKYPDAILLMTYNFKDCNHRMINENYKIKILFTKNNNFSILLELINHPTIGYDENEYGEGIVGVIYNSFFMQLYKGVCPGYSKTKSIIYYTCNDYINHNRTLLDDNIEFEKVSENTLPFMLDRLSMSDFEACIKEFIESDIIMKDTTRIETSSILQ